MEKGRVLPFQPSHAEHRACLRPKNKKFSLQPHYSPWSRFSPQNHRQVLAAAFALTSSPEISKQLVKRVYNILGYVLIEKLLT